VQAYRVGMWTGSGIGLLGALIALIGVTGTEGSGRQPARARRSNPGSERSGLRRRRTP
jgi:hypothetical protein